MFGNVGLEQEKEAKVGDFILKYTITTMLSKENKSEVELANAHVADRTSGMILSNVSFRYKKYEYWNKRKCFTEEEEAIQIIYKWFALMGKIYDFNFDAYEE